MEIQKQAVDLDEEVFGVAAPAVGPWQRQLNELGGVKPLAFGQYGELGPGVEQLLDQLAEEGADEAAKRYLIPNRGVAKGVQLRLLRQRVGDDSPKGTGGCAPTPPALRTTGVGHRGGEARRARRVPQRSPGKGVDAWTTALLSTAWAARPIRAWRAAQSGWRRRMCARPCCV
jgi:hypothetical protein